MLPTEADIELAIAITGGFENRGARLFAQCDCKRNNAPAGLLRIAKGIAARCGFVKGTRYDFGDRF
jgi:hypothetical protein